MFDVKYKPEEETEEETKLAKAEPKISLAASDEESPLNGGPSLLESINESDQGFGKRSQAANDADDGKSIKTPFIDWAAQQEQSEIKGAKPKIFVTSLVIVAITAFVAVGLYLTDAEQEKSRSVKEAVATSIVKNTDDVKELHDTEKKPTATAIIKPAEKSVPQKPATASQPSQPASQSKQPLAAPASEQPVPTAAKPAKPSESETTATSTEPRSAAAPQKAEPSDDNLLTILNKTY